MTLHLSSLPRVVADVNVILNGAAGKQGSILRQLHERFRHAELRYVLSQEMLSELKIVLTYPKIIALGLTPALAFEIAVDLLQLGEYTAPVAFFDWPSLPDRKDWYLLDLLYTSGADCLITQDKDLLRVTRALGLPALHPSDLKAAKLI